MNQHKQSELIGFCNSHRILVILLGVLFSLFTIFGIHRYSVTLWNKEILQSDESEILLGHSRPIRSDDWLVNVQTALSQIVHSPQFPVVNKNIGSGQNMLVFSEAPVLHPTVFFRPWTWGYFMGADTGLAWSWWWRELGLIYSSFLLFMVLSRKNFILSLTLAMAFCFSAFVQFWSANDANCQIAAVLCCVSFVFTVKGSSKAQKWAGAFLLGWAGGCLLNSLYPAYLVPLGYYFLAVAIGFLIEQKLHVLEELRHSKISLLLRLAFASAVFAIAAGTLFWGIKDVLPIIDHSAYPGTRFETGGYATLGTFFASPLIPFRRIGDWQFLGNICEASGFLFIFPGLIAYALARWARIRIFPGAIALLLIFLMTAVVFFDFFGFSPLLASLTQMKQVTVRRSVVVFGLAEFSLACVLLRDCSEKFSIKKLSIPNFFKDYAEILIGVAVLACFYLAIRHSLYNQGFVQGKNYSQSMVFVLSLFFGVLMWRPRVGAFLLLSFSFVQTGWFNPLVKGGGQALLNNPILEKIRTLDKAGSGTNLWAVYGSAIETNLPRLAGVHSISGTIFPPQLETFRPFDPLRQQTEVYNRYANVAFSYALSCEKPMVLIQNDFFIVNANPDCPELAKAQVSHLLVLGNDTGFQQLHGFTKVYQLGSHHIYIRQP